MKKRRDSAAVMNDSEMVDSWTVGLGHSSV
jgi:hypothetical protein